jgi:hypothetical protein
MKGHHWSQLDTNRLLSKKPKKLDMVKPINHQGAKKLLKVKEILESKFGYITLGLSYEHMKIIAKKILKMRRRMWMLIHNDNIGFWTIV